MKGMNLMRPLALIVSTAWLRLAIVCLATLSTNAARAAVDELRALLDRSINRLSPPTIRELFKLSEAKPTTPMPDPRLFVAGQLSGSEMQAGGTLLTRYGCSGERWQIVCQPASVAKQWRATSVFDYLLLSDGEANAHLTLTDEPIYVVLASTDDPGVTAQKAAYGRSHPSPRSSDTSEPNGAARLLLGIRGLGNWAH